jgi:GGDEF domain-containing protein
VNLDGFKTSNEAIGPTLGDCVIIEIGRRIESRLRLEDTVSRPETKEDAARDTARLDARFKAAFIDERPTIQDALKTTPQAERRFVDYSS